MSEAKFVSLRKRLDQLGYRQSLSVDSVPLAERLLGDLLHTTESLKDVRVQLGQHKQQKVTRRHRRCTRTALERAYDRRSLTPTELPQYSLLHVLMLCVPPV